MNALAAAMMGIGLFFILTATLGILRLPDFYCRLHAQGKCDTVGVACALGALALYEGWTLTSAKIAVILLFIVVANPTTTHALGRAAWRAGLKIWRSPAQKTSPP